MADYRLSRRARDDVSDILDYSLATFGEGQAERYTSSLLECFQRLSEYRHLGRDATDLAEGLHAFEHQSHVIYYIPSAADILVVRVLHHSRDARRHL